MSSMPGDAMLTQCEICRVIIDGGGHYFFAVRDNQPALKANIALAIAPDSSLSGMVAVT
jgi:hypothetical protein